MSMSRLHWIILNIKLKSASRYFRRFIFRSRTIKVLFKFDNQQKLDYEVSFEGGHLCPFLQLALSAKNNLKSLIPKGYPKGIMNCLPSIFIIRNPVHQQNYREVLIMAPKTSSKCNGILIITFLKHHWKTCKSSD